MVDVATEEKQKADDAGERGTVLLRLRVIISVRIQLTTLGFGVIETLTDTVIYRIHLPFDRPQRTTVVRPTRRLSAYFERTETTGGRRSGNGH